MKTFASPRFRHACAALAVTGSLIAGVAHAGSSVPFKASIAIQEHIQPIGAPPCVLLGDISGTGTATQLGKVRLHAVDCINPIDPTFTAFTFASRELVLTAANGDQIFATSMGTLTFTGQAGLITGSFEITGGTGRFANATGLGSLEGAEDRVSGQGHVELTGTISY
jgi:hypothetical protein